MIAVERRIIRGARCGPETGVGLHGSRAALDGQPRAAVPTALTVLQDRRQNESDCYSTSVPSNIRALMPQTATNDVIVMPEPSNKNSTSINFR